MRTRSVAIRLPVFGYNFLNSIDETFRTYYIFGYIYHKKSKTHSLYFADKAGLQSH